MDIIQLLDKIYGFLPNQLQDPVRATVENGAGAIHYASFAINYIKNRKINKELSKHNVQIANIIEKLEASKNELFLKQEVFPIILNRIMNDEQEEKIKIILNGFEYIIDNDILDLDKVFNYYDVLAEMRLSEIIHLSEKYVVPEKMESNKQLNKEDTEDDSENEEIERYMDNKLFRLGILEYAKEPVNEFSGRDYTQSSIPYKWQPLAPVPLETNMDKFTLSNFGKRFIKFFYEEETEE